MRSVPVLLTFALAASLAADSPFVKPEGWGAFFKDPESGKEVNLTEPLSKIPTKTWLGLSWTDFVGPKLRIAVMPVENRAARGMGGVMAAMGASVAGAPVGGVEDLLGASLASTGRFRLFERKSLDSVLAEKSINAQAGEGAPSNPAQASQAVKALGVQYLVLASVLEWTPDKSKKGGGGLGVGSLGRGGGILGAIGLVAGAVSKSEAEVAMAFRIVDSSTGEVKWQFEERATAGSWGFNLGGGAFGGGALALAGGGMQEKTPVNYAVKACVNKAVYRIAQTLKDQPWAGSVMKIAADKIYINAGKDTGLETGMVLRAFSVGEALKDPATGEILDVETKPAGQITITEVRDRIAIGSLSEAPRGASLRAGDRVEMGRRN